MRLSEFVHEGDNAIILHLCMCVYTNIHICIHVCVCVCVFVCACVRVCVCKEASRAGQSSRTVVETNTTKQIRLAGAYRYNLNKCSDRSMEVLLPALFYKL